jgi:hypothetical protein
MIERHSKAMAIERRIPNPGGVGMTRKSFLCRVEVEIDMDALLDLIGRRAIGNKSKRARFLWGIIKGQIQVGNELHNGENDKGTARG